MCAPRKLIREQVPTLYQSQYTGHTWIGVVYAWIAIMHAWITIVHAWVTLAYLCIIIVHYIYYIHSLGLSKCLMALFQQKF